MKQEDYVSVDVARLLEEKGYKCEGRYIPHEITVGVFNRNDSLVEKKKIYKAPSLAQAAKWLREKHNIAICPVPYSSYWDYTIFDLKNFRDDNCNHKILGSRVAWESYEQALNEGIKEALKMI